MIAHLFLRINIKKLIEKGLLNEGWFVSLVWFKLFKNVFWKEIVDDRIAALQKDYHRDLKYRSKLQEFGCMGDIKKIF